MLSGGGGGGSQQENKSQTTEPARKMNKQLHLKTLKARWELELRRCYRQKEKR